MPDSVPSCPVCGGELPSRTTGRPAVYCGKRCRQAANRAKHRAQVSARHAAWLRSAMERDLKAAHAALYEIEHLLAEPLRVAEVDGVLAKADGAEDWHVSPPTGWEDAVRELAAAAARHSGELAGHLREHARSATEHAQAARLAGIRRAPAPRPPGDETPAGNVADTAVAAAATKPGTGPDVDADAVYDAIEDLVMATDATTAAGGRLPAGLADAVAGPAAELAEAWAEASGDGPLAPLAEAARRLVDAARPHETDWPSTLATTIRIAEHALAPLR